MFLANYGDTLTDAPLDELVGLVPGGHGDRGAACRCARRTRSTSSTWTRTANVTALRDAAGGRSAHQWRRLPVPGRDLRLRWSPESDLVDEPFAALASQGALAAYPYDGFWVSLDTLKELEIAPAARGPATPRRGPSGGIADRPAPAPDRRSAGDLSARRAPRRKRRSSPSEPVGEPLADPRDPLEPGPLDLRHRQPDVPVGARELLGAAPRVPCRPRSPRTSAMRSPLTW